MSDLYKRNDDITYYLIFVGLIGAVLRCFAIGWSLLVDLLDGFRYLPFYSELALLGRILLVAGMIGLANLLVSKTRRPFLIVFFSLYAVIQAFFYIDDTILSWEQSIIVNTIFVIPFLTIYLSYWSETYCKLIFLLRILSFPIRQARILLLAFITDLQSILPELGDIALDIANLLRMISNVLGVIEYLLLILWFWKVFKVMQSGETVRGETPKRAVAGVIATGGSERVSTGYTVQGRSVSAPSLSETPMFSGMPLLAFWCTNCNEQVKLSARGWKEKDFRTPHGCPKCNSSNVLAWYAEPDSERYMKFVAGLVIIAGAIILLNVELVMGSYGVDPLMILGVIALVEFLVGGFLMYTATRITVNQPPAYAAETVEPVPNSIFMRELTILVIIGLIGGAVIWQLDLLLLVITMGVI
ncbi:MAG: hypothetical protein ACFFD4_27440 [Candidatus Odinarchaeota archaeon]